MIRTSMFLRRNVYNSKLNREKFRMIKKKMNERNNTQIRKFFTKVPDPDPDPFPDWWFIFIASITAYSVGKINGSKKR